MYLSAKDGVLPTMVGVSPAKGVGSSAKLLFLPATCSHLLIKVGLSLVRAFFASERLLIVSTNAVYSLVKFGSLSVISKCSPIGRI
jgi:hypothetical protein